MIFELHLLLNNNNICLKISPLFESWKWTFSFSMEKMRIHFMIIGCLAHQEIKSKFTLPQGSNSG